MHNREDNLGACGGYDYHSGSLQLSTVIYFTINTSQGFLVPQSITVNEFLPKTLE